MSNRLAFLLGLIGGILLISANVVGGIGLWQYLPLVVALLGLPTDVVFVMNMILSALKWIAGLGGIAVISGSILLLMNRVSLGKFIIGLGAGMGLFSLILLFVGYFLSGTAIVTWPLLIWESPGLLGAILSILARFKAKSPEQTEQL